MINNPDLQLNTTISWWITSILLFHFNLCHISTDRHYRVSHPRMTILQIWMILRIGWTILYSFCITLLNDRLFPSSAMSCSTQLGFCFPCLPPSVSSVLGCFLLLPILPPFIVQSYSFVFHSPTSKPIAKPDSSTIPWSTKAIARETQIRLIQGFLENHA